MRGRLWWVVLTAGLLLQPVRAKDYSKDWKFMAIIQPQIGFGGNIEPQFRWRRLRGVVWGPLGSNLKGKVQINVDEETERVRLLDCFLEYRPVDGPLRLNFRGGMFHPALATEGFGFADTVNYSYLVASNRLFERSAGFETAVGFLGNYQLSLGAFTGNEAFNDVNGVPNYALSFTTAQPMLDARAWWYFGQEVAGGAESRTSLLGAEITNAHLGRVWSTACTVYGRRYGRRMFGAYAEVAYKFNRDMELLAKFDWADLNRDVAFSTRQRYTLSWHQRLTPWMTSKWDGEYDQKNNEFSFLAQGDIRF
ncbi:MAG: hypothetical protein IT204_02035 [Fimbriimonadaceae bacterium]|nr:hypothetical protein [Fimbriimonadaceae bacterium]